MFPKRKAGSYACDAADIYKKKLAPPLRSQQKGANFKKSFKTNNHSMTQAAQKSKEKFPQRKSAPRTSGEGANDEPLKDFRDLLQRTLRSPIRYHTAFAEVAGSAKAGILLSQIAYWSDRVKDSGGWLRKSEQEFEKETALSRKEQYTARANLEKLGIIELQRRGRDGILHYRLCKETLDQKIKELPSASQDASITDFLQRIVAFHPVFAQAAGNVAAGLLLSHIYYWQPRGHDQRWLYKTEKEFTFEIGLSRKEQASARKLLVDVGLLQIQRRGNPARLYYHINSEVLYSKILSITKDQSNTETAKTRVVVQLSDFAPRSKNAETLADTGMCERGQLDEQIRTTGCAKGDNWMSRSGQLEGTQIHVQQGVEVSLKDYNQKLLQRSLQRTALADATPVPHPGSEEKKNLEEEEQQGAIANKPELELHTDSPLAVEEAESHIAKRETPLEGNIPPRENDSHLFFSPNMLKEPNFLAYFKSRMETTRSYEIKNAYSYAERMLSDEDGGASEMISLYDRWKAACRLSQRKISAFSDDPAEIERMRSLYSFENWETYRHLSFLDDLKRRGVANFCSSGDLSKRWYEWAIAAHPEKFTDIPA